MSDTTLQKSPGGRKPRAWAHIASPELLAEAKKEYEAYSKACFKLPNCRPVPFHAWVEDWLKLRALPLDDSVTS